MRQQVNKRIQNIQRIVAQNMKLIRKKIETESQTNIALSIRDSPGPRPVQSTVSVAQSKTPQAYTMTVTNLN